MDAEVANDTGMDSWSDPTRTLMALRHVAGPTVMNTRRTLRRLGALLVVIAVVVRVNAYRLERTYARFADDLSSEASSATDRRYSADDLDGLPAPVRRYFETVLTDGQPYVRTAHLEQRGEFRLGGRDAEWRPLTATQQVTVDPPGFVWDATIDLLPFVPTRVVDAYAHGEGILRAKVLSTIPVANAGPDERMNEGELVRYLAEAVWYPTALLPGEGVEWEPVDDRTARATLEHGGNTASVEFHFDGRDLISRVTTERYRQEDGSYAPWTGYFRAYEDRNGMYVPTDAEVEWNLPDGDLPYWAASVVRIEHE